MAGDFTIDFWYYPTAAVSPGYVYGKYNSNSDGWAIFVIPNWSSGNLGYLSFYYGNYGSNESATNLRSNPITLNVWHYCRITRASGVFYMSVNGKVGARSNYGANGLSWSDTRTFNANTTIGITGQASGYALGQAYLADFRVINGTALTTSDFTPPTAPVSAVTNTKLLTCTNKNNIWDAGIGKTITKAGNATASNTQRKFATSSAMYFDGSGDNLLLDYNSSLNLNSDFTIECWFFANARGGMILNMGGGSGIAWASYEFVNNTDGINFAGSSSNSGYDIGSETGATGRIGTIALNTWNHLAVTRNGNVYRGFVNGTQGYTQTLSLTPYDTSTRGLAIGSNYATTWGTGTPTNTVNGYIQDVRITNGLARYTSAFTPPTAEFVG
jgi:hypothetical protein